MVLITKPEIHETDLITLTSDADLVHDVITNPLYFQKILVEDQGNIIAASFVRVTSEMTLLLNESIPNITKQKVISKLLIDAKAEVKRFGINQTHVWTDINPILMARYGFAERKERSYITHF